MSLGGTKKPPAKPAIALSTGDILWANPGRAVRTNITKAIHAWLMEIAIVVIWENTQGSYLEYGIACVVYGR